MNGITNDVIEEELREPAFPLSNNDRRVAYEVVFLDGVCVEDGVCTGLCWYVSG